MHSLFALEPPPERFTVELLAAKESPVQGLSLTMDGGVLVVNDVEARDLVLWRDKTPDLVEVLVRRKPKARSSLKVWNVWRVGMDVTQAWLGNAAMRVSEDDSAGTVVLHCSDGEGPVTFDDLKVLLRLD